MTIFMVGTTQLRVQIDRLVRSWKAWPLLTALYCTLALLAMFMLSWVIILPSSWLIGHWEWHDSQLNAAWERDARASFLGGLLSIKIPTPRNLVFKYDGHSLVQFTHVLPSAVWSLAIPLQLYPQLRSTMPRLHRVSGYMFTCSALLMAAGFVVIDYRGLYYFKTDFPSIPEHEAMTRWPVLLGWIPHVPVFRLLMVWFVTSLLISVRSAQKKRFITHRSYMYRHLAAGIWVALQRLYVFGMACLGLADTPVDMKMNFGDGAVLGAVFAATMAELAIWSSGRTSAAGAQKNS